jgi:hypothetical protein
MASVDPRHRVRRGDRIESAPGGRGPQPLNSNRRTAATRYGQRGLLPAKTNCAIAPPMLSQHNSASDAVLLEQLPHASERAGEEAPHPTTFANAATGPRLHDSSAAPREIGAAQTRGEIVQERDPARVRASVEDGHASVRRGERLRENGSKVAVLRAAAGGRTHSEDSQLTGAQADGAACDGRTAASTRRRSRRGREGGPASRSVGRNSFSEDHCHAIAF